MNDKHWPLAVDTWGDEERSEAMAVIDSGRITMGECVRKFEQRFARWIGARYAVCVNSGSSANLLATAALTQGLGKYSLPHEAIVPAIAWPTTYAPLAQHGYKLRVCDVDPLTLNVDMEQVEKALTSRTKLLVGASILGNPAPLIELRKFADNHALLFLEDNCESLGAAVNFVDGGDSTLRSRKCGTFGDIGTHSFFFSHHLSTGEGGMLVTDDANLYELAICMRAHGWDRDLPLSSLDTSYRFLLPGYNVRPTELVGAVGLVQLEKLEANNSLRRENGRVYWELFNESQWWRVQHHSAGAVPFGFTFTFQFPEQRAWVARELKVNGIEHRMITGGSFALHQAAQHYEWNYAAGGTPRANHAHTCGLFIGNHPSNLSDNLVRLRELLEEVLK